MTGGVWVSQVPRDSTLIKGFDSDRSLEDYQLSGGTARRNYAGEPLPRERFPQEMYGKYPDKTFGRQPDIFRAGGGFTVSSEFADVLRSANLSDRLVQALKTAKLTRRLGLIKARVIRAN